METKFRITRTNSLINRFSNIDIMKNLSLLMGVLFMLSFLVIFSSCDRDPLFDGIKGDGPTVSQKFHMPSFTGIDLDISADVYISQGDEQSVRVEAERNIINNIETQVVNNIWYIDFDERVWGHEDIKIYITLPHVTLLGINSSGDIYGSGPISTNKVRLEIDGSGDISVQLFANTTYIDINGSGDIKLRGNSDFLNVGIDGSGDIKAFNFITDETNVNVDGSGKTEIYVNNLLTVDIDGSGDIYYKGHPHIDTHISGSGHVHNSN